LIWSGTREGRERGLARLDLGLSDADQPGLVRYKRKFATEERAVSTVRWQPPSVPDSRAAEAVRLLDTVTRLLTDPTVPDAITRAGSDVLYRFFC
jgi:CelD/BcsL family acetyltransferase involved in cellulose biosynthesis